MMTRRPWFWPAYMLLLLGIVLGAAEYILSFAVPSWPARALRPIPIEALTVNVKTAFAETPELIPSYNDWALRDRPRSFARPADVRFRAALVGDSFLEGHYVPAPVPELVERAWAAKRIVGMEAINFGVAATGPRQYHARIKNVALGLDPDVIMAFIYVGNDMISIRYDDYALPPIIDELPVPSVLGAVALSSDARHRRLVAALRQNGFDVVDLRGALDGVRGTYRLTDGHWTDRGTQIVAARIADALLGPSERPASNGSRTGH